MEGGRGRRRKETQHDGVDTWVARGEECDVSKNGSRNFFFEVQKKKEQRMFGNGNRKKDQKNSMSETNEMHSRSCVARPTKDERERESQQHQKGNSKKKKCDEGRRKIKKTRTIRR